MLQWHWTHESIRPVDWSRFAHGHDGNPRGSVPFKMSGLEGHRSLQALKRRSVPLHHQNFTSHLDSSTFLFADPFFRHAIL